MLCSSGQVFSSGIFLQLLFDLNIVSLLKDAVVLADWLDVSSATLVLVDVQVCKQQLALLFTISTASSAQYGVGRYVHFIKAVVTLDTLQPLFLLILNLHLQT